MNNDPFTNSNWTPQDPANTNNSGFAPNVPNSNGSFVLGIISICLTTVCCICSGQFPAVITSIIGLVIGAKAVRNYEENPSAYNEKSYKKAKTGRILNLISLIISILFCTASVIYVYLGMTEQLPPELQRGFRRNMKQYDFD